MSSSCFCSLYVALFHKVFGREVQRLIFFGISTCRLGCWLVGLTATHTPPYLPPPKEKLAQDWPREDDYFCFRTSWIATHVSTSYSMVMTSMERFLDRFSMIFGLILERFLERFWRGFWIDFGEVLERFLHCFWIGFGKILGNLRIPKKFYRNIWKSKKINANPMENRKSFENQKTCALIKHFIKELIGKIGPVFSGNLRKCRKS